MSDKPYIVGIGASAGGLEAVIDFLEYIPVNTGAAYIVIRHLRRDYVSEAQSILSRHTSLPVIKAKHHIAVLPDHIYLLTENTIVTIFRGLLFVRQRQHNEIVNHAVDIFLESLASDAGTKGIAVVLSGSGSDGAQGAIAIHNGGGMVMVQEPNSAQFEGMPKAAIKWDSPDFVLTPEQLATQLVDYLKDPLSAITPNTIEQ